MGTVTTHTFSAGLYVFPNTGGGAATYYPLKVLSGTLKLDDGWSPHVQASLTVERPVVAAMAGMAPSIYSGRRRAIITATSGSTPAAGDVISLRTYNLTIRSRTTSPQGVTLELESDEAVLNDYRAYPGITDDVSGYAYQSSLRALAQSVLDKIGASLDPTPGLDVPVQAKPSATNLITNGSFEQGITGWTGVNCTVAPETTWGAVGTRSLRLSSPTSQDSYASLGGDSGGMRLEMQAGRTYTISANIRLTAAGGTSGANARRLVAYWKPAGASGWAQASSAQAPNAATSQRLALTFTIPEGATEAFVRLYHGASAGTVWYDAVRLSEGDGTSRADTDYFDGSTTTDLDYAYGWDSGVGTTKSYRLATHGRDPDALVWSAGMSAWEYIQPIVESAGFRLFCGADRIWRLVDATYVAPFVTTTITTGVNLLEYSESVSMTDDTFFNAVVVRYTWTDLASGESQVQFRRANVLGSGPWIVRYIEVNHAPSGNQYETRLLQRARGAAPIVEVKAVANYDTIPSTPLSVTLPGDTAPRSLSMASVEFNFKDRTMRIESRAIPTNVIDL